MSFWNLTAPLAPHRRLGVDSPWDLPYTEEDIATIEVNDAHLIHIEMGSNTGTRLLTARMFDTAAPAVSDLAISELTDLAGAAVRATADEHGVIGESDVERILDRLDAAPEIRAAIIWAAEGSAASSIESAAAALLADGLEARGVALMLTDLAQLDPPARTEMLADWRAESAWRRPPWPSGTAQQFVRHYGPGDARRDFASAIAVTAKVPVVLGLKPDDALDDSGFLVTALPMFVRDAGSAPCSVVCRTEARKEQQ